MSIATPAKKFDLLNVSALYPPVEPYEYGLLEVGDGQQIFWEECGNRNGVPVVFLHGGPGGGSSPLGRRFFDPERYRIVLLDQRGCGRSRPHAGEPAVDLSVNTTWHLVSDLEALRRARRIDRWQLFGGSWGSTLALAYAQEYPGNVSCIILRGILMMRRRELDWYYNGGAGAMFPERYEQLLKPLGGSQHSGDVIAGYSRLLFNPDPGVHIPAAIAWSTWESATVTLVEDPDLVASASELVPALATARLESHYFVNGGWLADNQLVENMGRITGIPGIIVHGRYDVVTPVESAWELVKHWPGAELHIIPEDGHVGPSVFKALIEATDTFASITS